MPSSSHAMNLPDLDTIRAFFAADRFAAASGITLLKADEDEVACAMPITPGHLNAGGGVQGGAIFTLADFTFAIHANLPLFCGEAKGITVAQSNTISFLAAPKGDRLIARSACLSRGRNVSVFRISV
ncbi:MAG: PaaI family thioesterase, partial [Zoogloeaceae bacterium]|nr:PaaI family thioesterase [Zoogloeaceae bacterium]